jgi:hypothetical protein
MKKTISPARARQLNARPAQGRQLNAGLVQTKPVNSRLLQMLALLALSAGPALADNQEGAACVRTWSQPGSASGSAVGTLISQKPVDLGYGLCMDKEGKTAAAVSIIQTIGKDGTCGLRDDQRTAGQEYCQAFGSQFDFKLADDTPSSGATDTSESNTPKLVDGKTNGLPMTLQQAQLVSKNLDLKVSVDKPESKLLVMATLANKAPDKSPFNKSPFESLSLFRKNFSTDIKLTPLALGVTSESMDDSSRQDMLLAIAAGGAAAGIKTGNNMVQSFKNKKAQADAERWAAKKAEEAKTQAETAKTQAETAKTQAETAKTQAETAKTQAETAKNGYQENLERIKKEIETRRADIKARDQAIVAVERELKSLISSQGPTEKEIKDTIKNLSPKEAAPPKTIEEQIKIKIQKNDQISDLISENNKDIKHIKNYGSPDRSVFENNKKIWDEVYEIEFKDYLIKEAMISYKELENIKIGKALSEDYLIPQLKKEIERKKKLNKPIESDEQKIRGLEEDIRNYNYKMSQKEIEFNKKMIEINQEIRIHGIDLENRIKSKGNYHKLIVQYKYDAEIQIKAYNDAYSKMEKLYKDDPDALKRIEKHKELVEQLKKEKPKKDSQKIENIKKQIEEIKQGVELKAKELQLEPEKFLIESKIRSQREVLAKFLENEKEMIKKQEAQSKEIEEIKGKIIAEDRKIELETKKIIAEDRKIELETKKIKQITEKIKEETQKTQDLDSQNKKTAANDDSETSTQRRGGILPSQDTLKNFTVEAAKVLGVGIGVALVTAGVAAGIDYYVPAFCDQNTGEPGSAGTDPIFLGCLDPWTLAIKRIYSVIYKRSKSAGCRLPDLALKAAQKACQTEGGILSPMPVNSSYLVTNFPNLFDTSDQRSAMKKEFEGVTFDDQGKPWQNLEGKEVFATQNLDRDKAIKNTSPDQKAPA